MSISPVSQASPSTTPSSAVPPPAAAAATASAPAAVVTLSTAAQLHLKGGPNDVNHDGDQK